MHPSTCPGKAELDKEANSPTGQAIIRTTTDGQHTQLYLPALLSLGFPSYRLMNFLTQQHERIVSTAALHYGPTKEVPCVPCCGSQRGAATICSLEAGVLSLIQKRCVTNFAKHYVYACQACYFFLHWRECRCRCRAYVSVGLIGVRLIIALIR